MDKNECVRCCKENIDGRWDYYADVLRRIKGDEVVTGFLKGFGKSGIILCEKCQRKFVSFLTGIEVYPYADEA